MAEFAYNNAKNTSTDYILFELICDFHSKISYEENVNLRSMSKTVDQLAFELQTLMSICRKNL